jgi:hypothetical protein
VAVEKRAVSAVLPATAAAGRVLRCVWCDTACKMIAVSASLLRLVILGHLWQQAPAVTITRKMSKLTRVHRWIMPASVGHNLFSLIVLCVNQQTDRVARGGGCKGGSGSLPRGKPVPP